jgi:hypothetical protein
LGGIDIISVGDVAQYRQAVEWNGDKIVPDAELSNANLENADRPDASPNGDTEPSKCGRKVI